MTRTDEGASQCNGVQTGCNWGRSDGQMVEPGWPHSAGPARVEGPKVVIGLC